MYFWTGGKTKKKQEASHQMIITDILHPRLTAACASSWLLYLIVSWVRVSTYVLNLAAHFSLYGRKRVYSYVCKNTIMCVFCVCRHAWEKCVPGCLGALSPSVCVDVCMRMYACMMEGVEELGLSILDQHQSDWEDPVLLSWPHM